VNSGLAATYAAKLDTLVHRANDKPEAYRKFLQWSAVEAGIQGQYKFDSLMAAAGVIALDPMTDSTAMSAFDQSVGGYWFQRIGDSVVKHPPGYYADSFPIMGQRRPRNPGRLSEEIAAPPRPLVVFINGIFTAEKSANDVANVLAPIVDAEYSGRVETALWYNPTFPVEWRNWSKSHKCAYAWARRVASITDFDPPVTGFSMLADFARCNGTSLITLALKFDLTECATEVFSLYLRGVKIAPDPEFVGKLAHDAKGAHDLGRPTIFVAHSQGTLMFAKALERPELDTLVTPSANVCTAGFGLAPAISNSWFSTYHPNVHWGSFRIKHDILSLITIGNIPINYDVDSVWAPRAQKIDDWIVKYPGLWENSKLVKAYWGLQVHYLNPSYLVDRLPLLKDRLFGIMNLCVPPV